MNKQKSKQLLTLFESIEPIVLAQKQRQKALNCLYQLPADASLECICQQLKVTSGLTLIGLILEQSLLP